LPVGGIKEKVLAAHRAGIKTVILPRLNERYLEDVPAELRKELEFLFVDTAEEVLARALNTHVPGAALADGRPPAAGTADALPTPRPIDPSI